MSIGSFFKALVPFASSAVSDVDTEVAAIQAKASADIAAAKLKGAHTQAAATVAAKQARYAEFKKDYEAFLAARKFLAAAPATPSPAPSASTGPTGAA